MTRLDTLLKPRRGGSKGEQRHSDDDVTMNVVAIIVIMNNLKISDRNILPFVVPNIAKPGPLLLSLI